MKPVKRSKIVYTVEKDSKFYSWTIRETRSRRWYCFDQNSFCFGWSFMQSKAVAKLREWAVLNGFRVCGCTLYQGCEVN